MATVEFFILKKIMLCLERQNKSVKNYIPTLRHVLCFLKSVVECSFAKEICKNIKVGGYLKQIIYNTGYAFIEI